MSEGYCLHGHAADRCQGSTRAYQCIHEIFFAGEGAFEAFPDMALKFTQFVLGYRVAGQKPVGHDNRAKIEGIELFHMVSTRRDDFDATSADIDHGIAFSGHIEVGQGGSYRQLGFFFAGNDLDLMSQHFRKCCYQLLAVCCGSDGTGGNRLNRLDIQSGRKFLKTADGFNRGLSTL